MFLAPFFTNKQEERICEFCLRELEWTFNHRYHIWPFINVFRREVQTSSILRFTYQRLYSQRWLNANSCCFRTSSRDNENIQVKMTKLDIVCRSQWSQLFVICFFSKTHHHWSGGGCYLQAGPSRTALTRRPGPAGGPGPRVPGIRAPLTFIN